MKKLFVLLVVLFVSSTLLATPAPLPTVIYEEDFSDGTLSSYWWIVRGEWKADGAATGANPGPNSLPEDTFGVLSVSPLQNASLIGFDFTWMLTDLGIDLNELTNVSISYDIAQTDDSASTYPVEGRFYNMTVGGDLRGSRVSAAGGDERGHVSTGGWNHAPGSESATSISSMFGGPDWHMTAAIDSEPFQRLNRGIWDWQRLRHEWDTTQYRTMKLYADYEMDGEYIRVATGENIHPNHWDVQAPWPYPEGYSLHIPYGSPNAISWYFDNFTVTLNNPYLDWTLVIEDDFDNGIDPMWTTSGTWTAQGGDDTHAWGAMTGKMASAEADAYFKASIPATTPGELLAVTFTVEQSNGSAGHFPIFFGFGDAGSSDYYVQYASPDSVVYGGVSGAMTMLSFEELGDGVNPLDPTINDQWWNFGAGEAGMSIAAEGSTRVDMIINPYDNYPDGSISIYFDRELAAKWSNFRGIYSFNEVFFGIRNNEWNAAMNDGAGGWEPTWNFDNIAVYTRQAKCGDAGYLPGDLNQDCVVDFDDLALFATEWLNPANFPDFASLAADWFECTDPANPSCF